MKIYKLNSLTTLLSSFLIISLVFFLPVILIEALWNSTIGKSYTDITINFWQALILWLMVLVVLNILGIFKFEFAVETGDTFDKEKIKKKLESLQKSPSEKSETEEVKQDTKD